MRTLRSNLEGRYEEAFQAFWWHEFNPPAADRKEAWFSWAAKVAARLQKATGGRALEVLDEFAELVCLLAIEDPFERWDEIARLVSADWPPGLSAEEAVRQERE